MEKRYIFADDIYPTGIFLEILRDFCVQVEFESKGIQLLSMNQRATGYQMVTPRETERKDFLPNSASLTLL